jgi:hypothetical protein
LTRFSIRSRVLPASRWIWCSGVLLGRQDSGTERRCHFVVHLGNEVQRALVARRNQRVELVREPGRHGLLEKLRRQPGVRRAQLLVQSHRS